MSGNTCFSASSFTNPDDHARGIAHFNQQYLQTGPGRFEGFVQTFSLDPGVVAYRSR